jgi:hypothetical protein
MRTRSELSASGPERCARCRAFVGHEGTCRGTTVARYSIPCLGASNPGINSYRTPGDCPECQHSVTTLTAQLRPFRPATFRMERCGRRPSKRSCRLELSGCLLRTTCRDDDARVRRQSKQAPSGPLRFHFFQRRLRGLYGAAVHLLAYDQHN